MTFERPIKGAVVLITGANRGLGLAMAQEALRLGAHKVYAAARDASSVLLEGVVPLTLDVTQAADVQLAAERCRDVTLVVNNAGIARLGGFLAAEAELHARDLMETNYFGPLRMAQAFAPVLAANGGGALLNVLSVASWMPSTLLAAYSASKSAAWSLTNTLRQELAAQGTLVTGLHVGYIDTDLTHGFDVPKSSPQAVARLALAGVAAGATEVLADDISRQLKAGLSAVQAPYLLASAG